MNFVDTSISCEPIVEILPTDRFKWIDYFKKHVVQIGISLAAILFLVILIIVCICLLTKKQLLTNDNHTYTTTTTQNDSMANDSSVIAGVKFGDITGAAFDDSLMGNFSSFPYFRGILIQTADILQWIQCFYAANSSSEDFLSGIIHGIRGSNDLGEPFFLDEDEKVNKVQVKLDNVQLYNGNVPIEKPRLVVAIRFFTTKGQSSPDISQFKGDNYTEEYPGYTLGYIAGRSGRYIDQIQFYWYLTAEDS